MRVVISSTTVFRCVLFSYDAVRRKVRIFTTRTTVVVLIVSILVVVGYTSRVREAMCVQHLRRAFPYVCHVDARLLTLMVSL